MPLILSKLLLYLGTVLLVGGVAARLLSVGQTRRRWLGLGLALLVLGSAAQVWSTLSELGLTAPTDILDYLMNVGAGRAVLTLLMGAFLLLALLLSDFSWLALLGAAGVSLWGLAGIGHGAAHGDWVRILHALHAGAMSVWLGGLLALLSLKTPSQSDAQRFTPLALGCVITLAASGVLMALSHAGNLAQLPQSDYGRTLLLKLGLFGLSLLAVWQVRRAFWRGRNVKTHLLAEVLTLLLVLGATGQLTQLPPPSHPSGTHEGHGE